MTPSKIIRDMLKESRKNDRRKIRSREFVNAVFNEDREVSRKLHPIIQLDQDKSHRANCLFLALYDSAQALQRNMFRAYSHPLTR